MLLAACDFDGTLFFHDGSGVHAADREAIEAWRRAGHIFGIVTGRGPATLLPTLARHPLPFDFLVCNNGALVLDGEGTVTDAVPLPHAVREAILAHEALAGALRCALFTPQCMFLLEGKAPCWGFEAAPLPVLAPSQVADIPGLVQVSMGFADREASLRFGSALMADLEGRAQVLCSLALADVIALEAGKDAGIRLAMRRHGWRPEAVLTAGDDGNDLAMLSAFRGHAMEGSDAAVLAAARGRRIASVADLLRSYLG